MAFTLHCIAVNYLKTCSVQAVKPVSSRETVGFFNTIHFIDGWLERVTTRQKALSLASTYQPPSFIQGDISPPSMWGLPLQHTILSHCSRRLVWLWTNWMHGTDSCVWKPDIMQTAIRGDRLNSYIGKSSINYLSTWTVVKSLIRSYFVNLISDICNTINYSVFLVLQLD